MYKIFNALNIKYDVSNNKTQSCLIVADPFSPSTSNFYKVTFEHDKYVKEVINEAAYKKHLNDAYEKHLKDQSSHDDELLNVDGNVDVNSSNVNVQNMEIKSFDEFKKKFKGIGLKPTSNKNSAGGGGI